eukprot:4896863-Pleurochrysis_carterae.AAC.1
MRKLESLLTPYASRLGAEDMRSQTPAERVAYVLAAAERVRASGAAATRGTGGSAGVRGAADDDGVDAGVKGVVPAAYRKNLNAELQGDAYCAVRERLITRHRQGGADLD